MTMRVRRMGRRHESDKDPKAAPINRETIHTFGRVLAYIKPYKKWMTVSVIALLFSVSLGLILPLVIQNLVDVVLIDKNLPRLNQLAVGLLVVFIVQAIFSFIHRLTLAYVGERAIADIRVQVYSHLQSLSLKFFADYRTGEVVSRLTSDVTLLQSAITDNVVALLRQALTLLGASVLLFVLNWRLTLIILTGIPLISLTMVWLGRKIRAAAKQVQDALAEAANVVEETTTGIRIVKSFAREAHEIGRYTRRVNETFEAAMTRAKISAVLGPIIGFMAFASITITLWFGSFEVIQGRLSAGGLVAYLVYTMMVATPVATLAGLYAQFQSALGATERLFGLLDTTPDIASKPNAPTLPPIDGAVTFDNVSFQYNDRVSVLHDVTFTADPGQVIALVGPSGAGKTTLVNLIPRFYDVVAGRVLIDGYDVRDVDLLSLRDQIGIVPQETILFSESVIENIRYGRLQATRADIEDAARAAEQAEAVAALQDRAIRLLTLTGAGGMGKTRLAMVTAVHSLNNHADLFPDGVYFVPLAALDTPDQIISDLAAVLNIRLQPEDDQPLTEQLVVHLRDQTLLLVLDNMEHLLDHGGRTLVRALLDGSPGLKLLLTSREPLGLDNETVLQLDGLTLPPETAAALNSPAAHLLQQAARRVQPTFTLTPADAPALRRLCRRLMGMPLALELAGAWADTLSLPQMVAEIEQNVDFLEALRGDVPDRQRNLRAVFDYTWQRLTSAEQRLWPQLALFRDGFTFAAAHNALNASRPLPARLVKKSLLQFDREQDRYALHALLQQFGREKLPDDAAAAPTSLTWPKG